MPGSVQWMTAGRGLVHSEMPEQQEGRMRGFQLWVNLPARDKMGEPQLPGVRAGPAFRWRSPRRASRVKVIAGVVGDVRGPIVQPATDPVYLDIALDAGIALGLRLARRPQRIRLCVRRRCDGGRGRRRARARDAGTGGARRRRRAASSRSGGEGARLILVAGRPLREPVARYGPFVMNTKQEMMQAFVDFQEGKF